MASPTVASSKAAVETGVFVSPAPKVDSRRDPPMSTTQKQANSVPDTVIAERPASHGGSMASTGDKQIESTSKSIEQSQAPVSLHVEGLDKLTPGKTLPPVQQTQETADKLTPIEPAYSAFWNRTMRRPIPSNPFDSVPDERSNYDDSNQGIMEPLLPLTYDNYVTPYLNEPTYQAP